MNKQDFSDRKVDKIKLDKSKEYMWNYIQAKTAKKQGEVKEERAGNGFWNGIKSFFIAPKKLAISGAVAGLLIVAIFIQQVGITIRFFEIDTVHAHFEMTANEEDSSGVEADTAFTLTASEDISADTIEENLRVTPEVAFEVRKISDGKYKVNPTETLEADTVYNFSIDSDERQYSWSYQVKDTFKITGSLPADKSAGVPTDTGIEIYFTHENYDYDNIGDYFTISPKVKGNFEYHRRTLSFVPSGGLDPQTVYTVTVKEGLELIDSDQKLNEKFKFQFETNRADGSSYVNYTQFSDQFYEMASDSVIAVEIYDYSQEEISVVDMDVYEFKNEDAYIQALKERENAPDWSYYANSNYLYDTSELDKIGNFEASVGSVDWREYAYLPGTDLGKGYYLFQINSNGYKSHSLVQITDLAAYYDVSVNETLVWVNDLASGEPIKDAKVELILDEEIYKTDGKGIAVFDTPSNWRKQYDEREYEYIKISSSDSGSLITTLVPYDTSDNIAAYWHSFTTDRPIYKKTDLIKFWGFLKPKDSAPEFEKTRVELIKDWDTFVEEVPIEMESNDTFAGEIELDNVPSGYYYLLFYNGDDVVFRRSIYIEDYVKPSYEINIETSKQAIFAGEKVHFDIESKFFEGTPMPNLVLNSHTYNGQDEEIITDEDGKASLDFTPPGEPCDSTSYSCYNTSTFYLDVSSKYAEEAEISATSRVRVFNSGLNIYTNSETEDDLAKINIETNWIDLTKINSGENVGYNDYLGDVARELGLNISVTEMSWDKYETGEYYDFINKKIVTKYEYRLQETPYIQNATVKTDKSGKAVYEFKINPEKYYRVEVEGRDQNKNLARKSTYVYGGKSSPSNDYYKIKILNGDNMEDEYRTEFDMGDDVKIAFANEEVPLSEEEEGEFLFLNHNNGLQNYAVEDSPYYNFEFDEDSLPSVYLSGVWFDGKTYQKAYTSIAYFNKDLKELNVEIESDKEVYEPGEFVTLGVNVTDQGDDPVFAEVNFNLVDEAYYKIAYDYLSSPLDEIYGYGASGRMIAYNSHESILNSDDQEGKGGCFVSGTQILMGDGSYKNIEDIRVGDYVMTKKAFYSPEMVAARVTGTVEHEVTEYIYVNEDLKVTKEHVLFMNGGWDLAENLKVGDVLLQVDGNEVEVTSLRVITEPVTVYNFEVEGQHTYFANDFYVHNDKGGDGVRSDFEDNALFETVSTNSAGFGEVTFQLPDNITSWRITAKAIDVKNLQAGVGIENVNVSLPLFAELIMNSEYHVQDKPIIKFRAHGDGIEEGDIVNFVLNSASLGIKNEKIKGEKGEGSYFELPELKIGEHEVVLSAESGDFEDALSQWIFVRASRFQENVVERVKDVNTGNDIPLAKDGVTEVKLVDGGRSAYYFVLADLYYQSGDRLDQRLPNVIASELMTKYFGETWSSARELDVNIYQDNFDGGLKLLPYGSSDLRLSALALTVDPNPSRYGDYALKEYFYSFYENDESNLEEIVLALLGLANFNEPVLNSLKLIEDEESLSLEEKLYIGLAYERLGEKARARAIYEDIVVDVGGKGDDVHATGLAAVLGAALEEENAIDDWNFVVANGLEDDLIDLYQIGFVGNSLKYAEVTPVEFKVKVGDKTESVELENGESYSVLVMEGEDIAISKIDGKLGAVSVYKKYSDPDKVEVDDRLVIDKFYSTAFADGRTTINDAREMKEGDLVMVAFMVNATGSIANQSFMVTDYVPSGLKPISMAYAYSYYDQGDLKYSYPYKVDGQEISFYWNAEYVGTKGIVYYARVVTPGEFYVEPAKIESFYDPTIMNISDDFEISIEGL